MHKVEHLNKTQFTLLSFLVFLTIGMALFSWRFAGVDFRVYYAAIKVFFYGGNPYDYNLISNMLLETTGYIENNGFYYLPWFLIILSPFALCSYPIARLVWLLSNSVLWLSSLYLTFTYVKTSKLTLQKYLLGIFFSIVFLWMTLKYEQVGILLLFEITLALYYLFTAHDKLAGFLLACLLIKPTVSALVVGTLLLWSIKKRRYNVIYGFVATLFFFFVLFSLLIPGWYKMFLALNFTKGLHYSLNGPGMVTAIRINTTLLDWLRAFNLPVFFIYAIYATVVIMSSGILYQTLKRSDNVLEITALSILLTFWITPYALQYDFPPMVLVWMYLLGEMYDTVKQNILHISMLSMFFVVLLEKPISDGFWLVVITTIAYGVRYIPSKFLGKEFKNAI